MYANGGKLKSVKPARVGLNGAFGTLLAGRQYDLVADSLMPMAASLKFAGTLATHVGDVDDIWGDYPLSNVIKYGSFENSVGAAAQRAWALNAAKLSFPAMRNKTVRMVSKRAYPRALRFAA